MNSQKALTKLRDNPLKFLRKQIIRIAGHPAAAGPQQYYFYPKQATPNAWDISCYSPPGVQSAGFMAWSVPMLFSNVVNNAGLAGVEALDNGGPDLMVTGLLNGCTFCIEPTANGVRMTHVKPSGGTNAVALQNGLAIQGRFAGGGGGPVQTFGMSTEYSGTEDATLIGVREPAGWRIYAQIHTRMTQNILRAFRVHPA
jgi:hypothetical protein